MRAILAIGAVALVLVGCGEREEILPGERLPIRPGDRGSVIAEATPEGAPRSVGIALPPARRLAAWPMRVGTADNDPGHASLSAQPRLVFSRDIGAGNSRRQRIATDPVSDGARVFALDAQSRVTAVTTGGATAWSRDLVPAYEQATDASGGGLAVVDGIVYAATGYGELHALDAATGGTRWVQRLEAPITTPKVANGLVYVVSRDNRAWALDAVQGRIRWEISAAAGAAVMATSPAPAIADRLVVFPFSSGEMIGVLPETGIRLWGSGISGQRRGVAYNDLGDVTGDPVMSGGTIYAGTTAGRIVALAQASGARLWTLDEGAVSPMAVAGGSVFAVTDRGQLIRADAATGDVIWRQDLPFWRNVRLKRRKGVTAHFGPVLAGGRLWVASSGGGLRGFDPATGALSAELEVPGGAASRPIAFGDALYVVGRTGELHAFR